MNNVNFTSCFLGLNYAYPSLNMGIETRMTIGFALATVVFFADLYFIVKGMDNMESTALEVVEMSF